MVRLSNALFLTLLILWCGWFGVEPQKRAAAYSNNQKPWENLPFTFSPLVQQGSENLFPNPNFIEGTKGWVVRDGTVSVVEHSGKRWLRLGAIKDNKIASVITNPIQAKPLTLYEFRFHLRISSNVEYLPFEKEVFSGLHGYFTGRNTAGEPRAWSRIHICIPTGGKVEPVYQVFTTKDTTHFTVNLAFKATAGEALLTGFDLREVRVERREGRQILTIGEVSYAEMPRHPESTTPLQKVTIFHRSDPDSIFWYSRPLPKEVKAPLRLAATPGEIVVSTLAVYSPKPLTKLRISIGPLRSKRHEIPSEAVDWKVVKYLPRRGHELGWTKMFRWVPDFFISEPEGINTEAGKTTVFWLKLTVPEDAKAGYYHAPIVVLADGFKKKIELRLEVYPFRLAQPNDKCWALYADDVIENAPTLEGAFRRAQDIKAHGIDSVVSTIFHRGKLSWEGDIPTSFQIDPNYVARIKAAIKAGMRGPWLLWLEPLEWELLHRLKIPDEQHPHQKRPEKVAAAFQAALRAIKQAWEKEGLCPIAYVGVDEPGYWNPPTVDAFLWQYPNASAAGWDTYCTSSNTPDDPLGQHLTYHCYGGGSLVGPFRDKVVRLTREASQKLWYYATGSYGAAGPGGCIGNMGRNRYGVGFLFYKLDADGCMSWTFQRPRGNPFNDFEGYTSQYCITYPDPKDPNFWLDTPTWEGIRQGWYDYRYILTLKEQLNNLPKRHHAHAEFQKLINEFPMEFSFTDMNKRCIDWRARIAQLLKRLQRNSRKSH